MVKTAFMQRRTPRTAKSVNFSKNNNLVDQQLAQARTQAYQQEKARARTRTEPKINSPPKNNNVAPSISPTTNRLREAETAARQSILKPQTVKSVKFKNNNNNGKPIVKNNNKKKNYKYKELKINLEGLKRRLKYTRKLIRIKRFTTFDMIYKKYHKKVWGRDYNMNTNRLLQKTNRGYNNKPSFNRRLISSNGVVFLLNRNYNRYSRNKFYVPKVKQEQIKDLKNAYNINRFRLTKNDETNTVGRPMYRAKYTKYQPGYLLSKRQTLMEKLRNHKRRLKQNIKNKKKQIRNLGYKVGWFNW